MQSAGVLWRSVFIFGFFFLRTSRSSGDIVRKALPSESSADRRQVHRRHSAGVGKQNRRRGQRHSAASSVRKAGGVQRDAGGKISGGRVLPTGFEIHDVSDFWVDLCCCILSVPYSGDYFSDLRL